MKKEYTWNTRMVADKFEKRFGLTLGRQQLLIDKGLIDGADDNPGRGRTPRGLTETAVLQLLVASELKRVFQEFGIIKRIFHEAKKLPKSVLTAESYLRDNPTTGVLHVSFPPDKDNFVLSMGSLRNKDDLTGAKKIEVDVDGKSAVVTINVTELAKLIS